MRRADWLHAGRVRGYALLPTGINPMPLASLALIWSRGGPNYPAPGRLAKERDGA